MFEPEMRAARHVSPEHDREAHEWEARAEQYHGHVFKRGVADNYCDEMVEGIIHFDPEERPRFCVACGQYVNRWTGMTEIEPTDCPVNPPDKKTKRAKKA